MKDSEIISGLDDFLDKALSLETGGSVEYALPRCPGVTIQVRYQRPISIYHYRGGDCRYREVLWSPMKVRRYALKQMGLIYRRSFFPDFAGWRRRRMVDWWAREWAVR